MAHGSGGGSGGGGGGAGGRFGGGGGSYRGRIHVSSKPGVGLDRYVYYRFHKPVYVYCNVPPFKIHGSVFIIIICLFMIVGLLTYTITFLTDKDMRRVKPLDTPDHKVLIVDSADVLTQAEEADLYTAFESFQRTTGITPAFYSCENTEWIGTYEDLEKYAYDLYVRCFTDETHWLLVYSTDKEQGSENWYWEGMQGDETDPILSYSVTSRFNSYLQGALQDKSQTVGEAFVSSFDRLTETVMDRTWDTIREISVLLVIMFPYFLLVPSQIRRILIHRKALPCENDPKEGTCPNCMRRIVLGIHKSCPHCGRLLPASMRKTSSTGKTYLRQNLSHWQPIGQTK